MSKDTGFARSTLPRSSRGQLKCFNCRQTFLPKDGNWHNQKTQQIFLCKTCERTHSDVEQGASARKA